MAEVGNVQGREGCEEGGGGSEAGEVAKAVQRLRLRVLCCALHFGPLP